MPNEYANLFDRRARAEADVITAKIASLATDGTYDYDVTLSTTGQNVRASRATGGEAYAVGEFVSVLDLAASRVAPGLGYVIVGRPPFAMKNQDAPSSDTRQNEGMIVTKVVVTAPAAPTVELIKPVALCRLEEVDVTIYGFNLNAAPTLDANLEYIGTPVVLSSKITATVRPIAAAVLGEYGLMWPISKPKPITVPTVFSVHDCTIEETFVPPNIFKFAGVTWEGPVGEEQRLIEVTIQRGLGVTATTLDSVLSPTTDLAPFFVGSERHLLSTTGVDLGLGAGVEWKLGRVLTRSPITSDWTTLPVSYPGWSMSHDGSAIWSTGADVSGYPTLVRKFDDAPPFSVLATITAPADYYHHGGGIAFLSDGFVYVQREQWWILPVLSVLDKIDPATNLVVDSIPLPNGIVIHLIVPTTGGAAFLIARDWSAAGATVPLKAAIFTPSTGTVSAWQTIDAQDAYIGGMVPFALDPVSGDLFFPNYLSATPKIHRISRVDASSVGAVDLTAYGEIRISPMYHSGAGSPTAGSPFLLVTIPYYWPDLVAAPVYLIVDPATMLVTETYVTLAEQSAVIIWE